MSELSYKDALKSAMREEMQRDDRVFLLGEDIGVYGGAFGVTDGLLREFGESRVRDTPISEAAIAGAATGAALGGFRPVAEFQFFDFILVAMDQIINQAAKIRYMFGGTTSVPVVFRGPAGAGTGAAAQHSQSLEAIFAHIPGLKVVAPSTPRDAKGLLTAAIRDDNPVIFVEHKLLYKQKGEVPEGEFLLPLGKSEIKREGTDVTVVATSVMVPRALKAADELSTEGIQIEVIDPRTLSPLDMAPIEASVKKTGHILVVHEAVKSGGIGAEIAARIAEGPSFDYLDAQVARLGGAFTPIPYTERLETCAIPQERDIVDGVKALLARRDS